MTNSSKQENHTILKMSIQVRLNGFSFCIIDCNTNDILWFKKRDLGKENSPVKILEEIERLYAEEEMLQHEFNEVGILFSNDLFTIVPAAYFIEEEASTYLKFNTKILQTDVVAHDLLSNDLVNVYIPYTNINNYFFDKYGEFEYQHNISVLIDAILAKKQDSKEAQIYLNDYNNYYELVIVQNNKLVLANTFHYETKEDFIYYLLFTLEQLDLNPTEVYLWLMGTIVKQSDIYDIAYTYIRNIDFLIPAFSFTADIDRSESFHREAFSLLKTIKCE
tara:strand:+ start:36892 stop:37722 length:831 start_codon:yes stop_codon:yes gene_type:complete